MALLSGEVETGLPYRLRPGSGRFRMALLSGEVETRRSSRGRPRRSPVSGWLCYPGKLKLLVAAGCAEPSEPGFRMALLSGEVETGMARPETSCPESFPDGFAIRGS